LNDLTLDQLASLVRALAGTGGSKMPPWQEADYFQTPVVTATGISGLGSWVSIAPNAPNRVVLWIGTTQPITLTTDATIATSGGLPLSNTMPPLVIRQKDDANLCAQQWFAAASAGTTVTTIEIVLRQWPKS
jgi:hypothetical protein